jgi:hypothetical protein
MGANNALCVVKVLDDKAKCSCRVVERDGQVELPSQHTKRLPHQLERLITWRWQPHLQLQEGYHTCMKSIQFTAKGMVISTPRGFHTTLSGS